MTRVLLGALLSLVLCTTGRAADTAPATYRLDLFHTGGQGVEIFAIDRLRQEPLPWPGHPARAVDDGRSGSYRFEVRDAAGRLLQARGYASIFGEWVTTEEAQQRHRTFHESLRFPAPARPGPVHVRIYKRDARQAFQPLWEATLDTTDMFVDRSPAAAQDLVVIEQHGAPPDKVDLLLLGDGYTAAECAASFRADAERMTAALFRTQPFARRREDFNVWGLCPPAAASGIARPSTGVQRASPAGTTYDAFGSERYVLSFENRALREIAAQAPYEALVILANDATYGGGGIFGLYSTVAVHNSWADYLFVHEFGHHFAALADEYYTSPVAYAAPAAIVEPWEPNVTALLDRDQLKWRHRVATSTPIPTPWPKEAFEAYQRDVQARRKQIRADRRPESEMDALFREEQAHVTALFGGERHRAAVGAFRGANYDAQAYYRPQLDCIMFTRNAVPFCGVCDAALEQVIDSLVPGYATATLAMGMPALDLSLAWGFATALLIGALVGIERERHKQRQEHPEIAGLRTFMLVALFGALCGWVSHVLATPWLLAAGLVAVTAAVLTGYVLSVRMNPHGLGLTTEVAALATFLLGALATLGQRELAVGIGVIVATVLAYKQPLHGFVGRLDSEDVYAVLRLLIATFIVLPLLPNTTIDPWDALNPQSLWLLALLIAGLSLVGYVLTRLLGAHRGLPLTGLTGGLVSSTAVTLAFARQSREPQSASAHAAIASGILLAWTMSFARVLVEVLVVNRALLPSLLPTLLAMALVCAGFAAWHQRRAGRQVQAQDVPLRNPFSLTSAIKFAASFAVVLLVVKIVQAQAPETGLYVVAALAGTTDVDAITLSMAQYARAGRPDVASQAITIAVLSNTVIKAGMVAVLGTPALRGSILLATVGILVAGVGILLVT